jgi:hypothetical protein
MDETWDATLEAEQHAQLESENVDALLAVADEIFDRMAVEEREFEAFENGLVTF